MEGEPKKLWLQLGIPKTVCHPAIRKPPSLLG